MINAAAFYRKRILVTGAAGHIGSHLTRALVRSGSSVFAAVRPNADLWRIADVRRGVTVLPVNLADADARTWQSVFHDEPPRLIFHLGAAGVNPVAGGALDLVQSNIMGTFHLLEAAKAWGGHVDRFVYTGSCAEYAGGVGIRETENPQPVSEYGATKASGTLLAGVYHSRYGVPTVTVRPFTAYGTFESAHRLIAHAIIHSLRDQTFPLTGGKQTRDFIHVEDVVTAYLLAAVNLNAIGGVFNVCTGMETSIRAAVELITELTKGGQPRFGALPYRDNETWALSGDPTLAREAIGFSARIGLREGFTRTIQWFGEIGAKYPAYSAAP